MKKLILIGAVFVALLVPAGASGASTTIPFVAPAKGFTTNDFIVDFNPTRVSVANFYIDGVGYGNCSKRIGQTWYCKRGDRIGLSCSPTSIGVGCLLWNKRPYGITASVWVRARR